MHLIGSKVKIRNFETTDWEQFFKLVQDRQNHELAGLEYTDDDDFGHDLLDMYRRRAGAYVIASKDTDEMIGIIELNKRGESEGLLATREIGFVVGKEYRQQGFAKEAIQLLRDYSFNELDLTELWASTEADNVAPQKLLESLEFKYMYEADQTLPYTGQHNLIKYYLLTK